MAMSLAEIRAALSEKITSREQLHELILRINPSADDYLARPFKKESGGVVTQSGRNYGSMLRLLGSSIPSDAPVLTTPNVTGTLPLTTSLHHTKWWLIREWMRLIYGVYQSTPELDDINATHGQYALHCARDGDDKMLIAYTPDANSGEADRQLRTSLSKFLVKIAFHVPDDQIRDYEAAHRANMTDELTLLTGHGIVAGYLAGPSSCMSNHASHYGTFVHPTTAYDAPGFALAVKKSGDRVVARALTWVNPDDPEDKRYVRLYGDVSLKRQLECKGYRCAGLAGAKLRRLVDENLTKQQGDPDIEVLVVPYLDRPGGSSSDVTDSVSFGGVIEGDFIRLMSEEEVRTMINTAKSLGVNKGMLQPTSAGGKLAYRKKHLLTNEDLQITCVLTGSSTTNINESRVVYHKGEVGRALASAVPEDWITVYAAVASGPSQVLAAPDTPTFEVGVNRAIDNDTTRARFGYERLSERYYGSNQWGGGGETIVANDEHVILTKDAVCVLTWNKSETSVPRMTIRHVSEVDIKKLQKLHTTGEIPLYAAKDADFVERTPTGRRVVEGVHEVRRRYDGVLDFGRKLTVMWYIGLRFYLPRRSANTNWSCHPNVVARVKRELHGGYGYRLEGASKSDRRRIVTRGPFAYVNIATSYTDGIFRLGAPAHMNPEDAYRTALAMRDQLLAIDERDRSLDEQRQLALHELFVWMCDHGHEDPDAQPAEDTQTQPAEDTQTQPAEDTQTQPEFVASGTVDFAVAA